MALQKRAAGERPRAQPRQSKQSDNGDKEIRSADISRRRSSEGEILAGNEALDATVDLLCRRLLTDRGISQVVSGQDEQRLLTSELRYVLSGAFGGSSWPHMRINSRFIEGIISDLLPILRESFSLLQADGQDFLASAMDIFQLEDMRVMRIFQRCQAAALPKVSSHHESWNLTVMAEPDMANRNSGQYQEDEDNIDVENFEELQMDPACMEAARDVWLAFLSACDSKDAAGEAIFTAVFEAAPSLRAMFTGIPDCNGFGLVKSLSTCFKNLEDPTNLKAIVETLGFNYMSLDVQTKHVAVFRAAFIDVLAVEVGEHLTSAAKRGIEELINYIGGAIIYVKTHYAERLRVLSESWKKANDKANDLTQDAYESDLEDAETRETKLRLEMSRVKMEAEKKERKKSRSFTSKVKRMFRRDSKEAIPGPESIATAAPSVTEEHAQQKQKGADNSQHVPTTYPEMFRFNAAVMGFGSSSWMNEVLAVFDNIVVNVAKGSRLQEECKVLALRISKVVENAEHHVNLSEYKACMLASLRSLLPKDWSPLHEVAWNWLWDNVQRIVSTNLKVPIKYEKALSKFMGAMDEDTLYGLRKHIYEIFFAAAPAGQDYFKQSNTRLHFIADRVLNFTMDIIREPVRMVDDLSALGLRHVGYGIPTELFPPFVVAVVEVIATYTSDTTTVEAFRWTLGLISSMLIRTITEGSTVVMKAINANNVKFLQKAISSAPRGERAQWMLTVQVGSQSISPLEWAIESGSLAAAQAIIEDLLTFRADRERYYYGMEHLFGRHPDIVKMLCANAPTLLPALLDGLIWRSRNTVRGIRRVNYYVKYMMLTRDGNVSQALGWFKDAADCKIISHPVNVLVSDTMWKGIVRKQFLGGRLWFIISLVIFLLSQSVLPKLVDNSDDLLYLRWIIFIMRVTTYGYSLMRLIVRHAKKIAHAFVYRDFRWINCIPLPRYLTEAQEIGLFFLMWLLIAMSTHEPIMYCWEHECAPTSVCEEARDTDWWYTVFSMLAMAMHWVLIVDMAVFSTKLSAFLLVCTTVLSEVGRFLIALAFLLLTFGSAISCLRREHAEFKDVQTSFMSLLAITLVMMPRDYRELQTDPPLLFAIFVFVVASVILLLNLLIAQLNCSYEFIYQDMVGFARLRRAAVIVESLETCSPFRWQRFTKSLKLDQRVEFNEGDLGLAGAIPMNEPASLNPITHETIFRYGGTCSPEMRWPEDRQDRKNKQDRFERIEALVRKAAKKVGKNSQSNSGGGTSGSSGGMSGGQTKSGSESDEVDSGRQTTL